MGKLRIRITNEDLLKTVPNGDYPALFNRTIRFGIEDDLELMELYGEEDEFVGQMDRLYDNVFIFGIDRCDTSYYRVGSIHVLDANKKKDRTLYLKALEYDYGFTKDDYEIVS